MALSLAQLTTEIEDYITAHPDHWDTVVDIARNSGPPDPGSELPENATVFKDVVEWYTRCQKDGKNHLVLSGDDPSRRLMGFHISTVHNDDLGSYYIPLHRLKTQMEKLGKTITEYLRIPMGRRELGHLLGTGKAPAVGS